MDQQELLYKLAFYEEQSKNLQQQLQAVEQGILDLKTIYLDLDEIKGKNGENIMAHLGKGIFVEAKITSEDLLVDVGNKNIVKKSIEETKKIINSQTERLEKIKDELANTLDKLNKEIYESIESVESNESEKNS